MKSFWNVLRQCSQGRLFLDSTNTPPQTEQSEEHDTMQFGAGTVALEDGLYLALYTRTAKIHNLHRDGSPEGKKVFGFGMDAENALRFATDEKVAEVFKGVTINWGSEDGIAVETRAIHHALPEGKINLEAKEQLNSREEGWGARVILALREGPMYLALARVDESSDEIQIPGFGQEDGTAIAIVGTSPAEILAIDPEWIPYLISSEAMVGTLEGNQFSGFVLNHAGPSATIPLSVFTLLDDE